MFLNLSKGNILYVLDKQNDITWYTATIDQITPAMSKFSQNTFGQLPEMVVDIIALVGGERKEFKQVPANSAIADFGTGNVILADNKDSLFNYVQTLLQTSENIVNSADTHKKRIPQYKSILNELNANGSNDESVKALKEEVSSLKSQLQEAITLLKSKTINPE